MENLMHDWTLVSVSFDWARGSVHCALRNYESKTVSLIAEKVYSLHVPRLEEWGPSVSIQAVIGPLTIDGERQKLQVEMQSGDVIEIVAQKFVLPVS
jgi:hypothetical protein